MDGGVVPKVCLLKQRICTKKTCLCVYIVWKQFLCLSCFLLNTADVKNFSVKTISSSSNQHHFSDQEWLKKSGIPSAVDVWNQLPSVTPVLPHVPGCHSKRQQLPTLTSTKLPARDAWPVLCQALQRSPWTLDLDKTLPARGSGQFWFLVLMPAAWP